MKRGVWFYRYRGWNGATYVWPCHWIGALWMAAAVALAFGLADVIVEVCRSLKHPSLGWLSIIAVAVIYGGFRRIADRYADVRNVA